MGLLTRLRSRFGARGTRLGSAFTRPLAEVWDELEEQVDGELKKAGSSVVGGWEVGAAELARVVIAWSDEHALVERYSDALVPTLQPFQDLHKGIGRAMADGKRAGLATGRLDAATAPLVELMAGLDARADEGWSRTATHLGPLFSRCAQPDVATAQFLAGGRGVRQACVDADLAWRARLLALPEAPGLWEGLTGAAEAWQLIASRGLEFAIDRHVKGLVGALKAAR